MNRNWVRLPSVWLVVSLVLAGAGCDKPAERATPPATPPTSTNTLTSLPKVKPAFQQLVGRWLRPDGDYVLEFKSVNAEGQLDAGYFNPSPIRVEQARAVEAAGTQVMVVLRDVNYPGCVYKLSYRPEIDQLVGTYYQASMDQTYDVVFTRLGERKP